MSFFNKLHIMISNNLPDIPDVPSEQSEEEVVKTRKRKKGGRSSLTKPKMRKASKKSFSTVKLGMIMFNNLFIIFIWNKNLKILLNP